MIKRNITKILVLIVLTLVVCGCSKKDSSSPVNNKTNVALTQRQKDILREVDLPTDYQELSLSQQNAINSIEDMLSYAENKYKIPFSYARYSQFDVLEGEHMRAYPTSGDKETDSFTITKIEKGYTDDYLQIAIREPYIQMLSKNIRNIIPKTEFRVYADITNTSLEKIPVNNEDYNGNVSCSMCVFIDDITLQDKNIDEFEEEFYNFLYKNQLYCMAQVIVLKEDGIKYITKYNYTEYLKNDENKTRDIMYVNKE